MKEKELSKRIEETRISAQDPYSDSRIREKYEERLERLEKLYEDLYGF